VRATYQRSIDERTVYATTCRLALPGGRIKHLRVRGETEWQADRPVRTVGMVMDETDLIEAQVARDRLATVMEATSDIVSMADPQGRVFYFNRAGYQMLGLPLDQPLDSDSQRASGLGREAGAGGRYTDRDCRGALAGRDRDPQPPGHRGSDVAADHGAPRFAGSN
jgi:PAS domain-containing protein